MAGKKRRLNKRQRRLLFIALPLVALFIIFANVCDKGVLPAWLQNPLDSANSATGGLLYTQPQNSKDLSVHFIDVGQGDCILICCNGKNMLIDGGTPQESGTVENYLRGQGIKSLEYVVGTHPHDDHIGGLVSVIKDYDTGTIILNDAITTTQTYENLLKAISDKKKQITPARVNDSYRLGGAQFVILAPIRDYDDLNNTSVVLKLTYKNRSFLFTGDASEESEKDMLDAKSDLGADVLKVGHHGSATATTQDFLDAVNPQYAVISVGRGNSYGLPNTEVTQRLEDKGIEVFRTDIDKTVVLESDGQNIIGKEEK
jgi:competence protein ComEC